MEANTDWQGGLWGFYTCLKQTSVQGIWITGQKVRRSSSFDLWILWVCYLKGLYTVPVFPIIFYAVAEFQNSTGVVFIMFRLLVKILLFLSLAELLLSCLWTLDFSQHKDSNLQAARKPVPRETACVVGRSSKVLLSASVYKFWISPGTPVKQTKTSYTSVIKCLVITRIAILWF